MKEQEKEAFDRWWEDEGERATATEAREPVEKTLEKILLLAWVDNLHQKARLIRKGVKGMGESCDELADIIEKYVIERYLVQGGGV